MTYLQCVVQVDVCERDSLCVQIVYVLYVCTYVRE